MITILERHKNSSGDVTSYLIHGDSDNKQRLIPVDALVYFKYSVKNADYVYSANDFRAKKGYRIKTIIGTKNLLISTNSKPKTENISISNSLMENNILNTVDFYGKQYINICRKIRRLALEGKIKLDKALTIHASNSGYNTHLFKLIEASVVNVEQFIKGYLSRIQPYTLRGFQGSKEKEGAIWISDVGYKISLVIKLKKHLNNEYMLVYFHEGGIVKTQKGIVVQDLGGYDFSDKLCAVLDPEVKYASYNIYNVAYTVQRGFMTRTIESESNMCTKNGVALVKYEDIRDDFQAEIDILTQRLVDMHGGNVHNNTSVRIDVKHVSIISYGYKEANFLSLLIDIYAKNSSDRKIKMMLVQIAESVLEETDKQTLEAIAYGLADKFGRNTAYNNKLYSLIISKCKNDLLALGVKVNI